MKPHPKDTPLRHLPSAVAIVGMAARFPGARNLEEFRRNLEHGIESITFFSDQELLQAGIDPAVLSHPDYVKAAPLLEDADQFDAGFFEYSPREAMIMDPQQRLFLECAWEALEDAGHAGDAYGSATGVFSGGGGVMSTYLLSDTHFNPHLTGTTASLQHVGNDKDYLSTRVSYKLNLRGPSLTVQTACSTSLVAVHLACQSLLTGECDMALAGGTTVRVPQRTGYLFKEGNVFSRDGHCRAFDANAQGTVFGSGIGVVVLKRLKDAERDGDAIRAVIRGTAINNDGSERKSSYWAPHAEGQADAMRRALSVAQVEASTIAYVEAHGTATIKGDPTEVRALTEAFGSLPARSCAIGSVKSNIGHPESAAGVAGLIKAVLSLESKVLFPTLHYSRPNPEIASADAFYVNAASQPWPERTTPRRAAVNSLGIGGTNAFAILEEAPERHAAPTIERRPCHVLALSAKSPEALKELKERFRTYLESEPAAFADVCYTANVGRAHFDHRIAIVASSTEEALARLTATEISRRPVPGRRPRVAFLFTGQGSQYANMARDLYQMHDTFRDTVDRCATLLSGHLPQPLLSVLQPERDAPPLINETAYTQPALFTIEYALAVLWRSWGVEPDLLVGHSVGEIVAACVSGVMSLDDGLKLTAARGRLMQALPTGGGMAAVRCPAAQAEAAAESYRDTLSIAAINGPEDVVISGRLDHLDAVVARLEREGIAATRLNVSHAFHSPLMDPMLADFARVARSINYAPPAIPLISNVTGQMAASDVATPDYWVDHVRSAVRFAEGIAAADAQGVDAFVEIGPNPVLLGMARQSVAQGSRAWLPSLRSGRPDWHQLAESLAALYVCGVPIDWAAFESGRERLRVHLPTYPFQRKRYWIDAPKASAASAEDGPTSLVGHRLRLPGSREIRYEARWTARAPAYLGDHRLFETVVVPGASHLAMTLSALEKEALLDGWVLEDIVFPQALTLADDRVRTAQLVLTSDRVNDGTFDVVTLRDGHDDREPNAWLTHATGRLVRRDHTTPIVASVRLADLQARCRRAASGADFYDRFWRAGYHLQGAFRWISQTSTGDGELLCELTWPDLPDDQTAYPLYPSLIDACFQCVFAGEASELLRSDAVYVPFSIRRVAFHVSPRPGSRLWCHVRVAMANETGGVDAEITLCDDTGRVVAGIDGCQLREVRRAALLDHHEWNLDDALYDVEWRAHAHETPVARVHSDAPGTWLVFADDLSPVSGYLIESLQARGERAVRVARGARYARVARDQYEIDGAAPEDMRRLLDEVLQDGPLPCRGLVHLWSLDTAPMDVAGARTSREGVYGSVVHLVQAVAHTGWEETPRLWLVTRGAQGVEASPAAVSVQQAPLWGLGRVIALEHPELKCVRVDLDPSGGSEDAPRVFDDVWSPGLETELAYRNGGRYVPRLVRAPLASATDSVRETGPAPGPIQVRLSRYGRMDNLTLLPLTRRDPQAGEVEIEVRAAGLNFRDVLNALGMLEAHYATHLGVTSATDMTFGFECAGTVTAVGDGVPGLRVGDDVIAVASHDALASFITLRHEFVAPKPPAITFEEAATLPLAFLTAYHGLHTLAGLRSGDRVLIHAAAGGVGYACVRWAQQAGAEVFATASPGKWPFLEAAGVTHVMSSRTLGFGARINALTDREGIDVVVNTLSGPFVDESFEALKPGGRFVELGKRDVWSADQVRDRRPDVSYFPFDLVDIAREEPAAIAAMLAALTDQVLAGAWTPLPLTVFPVSKVTEAFRYMADARHIGKVVVSMPRVATAQTGALSAIRADATYLLTGGLGALGLEIAHWLVAEGARHLALVSRRPTLDEAAQLAVERLTSAGARVEVLEADVSDAAHVGRVLTEIARSLPPLRGIVHAAGVLDDGVLLQQSVERFRNVMAPKVEGSWNLHVLTQDLPLDFFVCFSSVASLLGNAGQGNYAAANAFMDTLAHHRRACGLPALTVNWGPWGGAGMAAEPAGHRQRRLADQGYRPLASSQGVEALAGLIRTARPQAGVASVNWSEFLRSRLAGRTFIEEVAVSVAEAPRQDGDGDDDVLEQMREASDPRAVLSRHVRRVVGRVLGLQDADEVEPRARLFDRGLESLMAVELRGRFQESLGCSLRPTLVFDYPTVEALTDHLLEKVREQGEVASAPTVPAAAQASAPDGDLLDLSEDEIAERLVQELGTAAKVQER